MNDEAIYLLTKLKVENYEKCKDRKFELTYSELIDYVIKTLKLIERVKQSDTSI